MPSMPTIVNPYLTLPDHITDPPNNDIDDPFQSKNATNVLPSAHDAQPTSKWSDHEDTEFPTPHILSQSTPAADIISLLTTRGE